MYMMDCPDCGKEISTRAKICPNCGCVITKKIVEEYEKKFKETTKYYQNARKIEKEWKEFGHSGRTLKIKNLSLTQDEIKELFEKNEYQKCLEACYKYIAMDPVNNADGYYYACLCFGKLEDYNKELKFGNLYEFMKLSDYEGVEDKTIVDARFYGINNLEEIISFANKYNVSIELACLNYGLDYDRICIVKLLIAKNYYAINDSIKADALVDQDSSSIACKTLKENVLNPNSYQYMNYDMSKAFVQKLERKK